MSHDIQIFLGPSGLPSVSAWQKAIDDLGFVTKLDPMVDIQSHSGFWPATFDGRPTGFEFSLDDVSDVLNANDPIAAKVEGSTRCASFTLHSDMVEMCAAMEAATALAMVTCGWYYYPDEGTFYDADQANSGTREAVEFVRNHIRRQKK